MQLGPTGRLLLNSRSGAGRLTALMLAVARGRHEVSARGLKWMHAHNAIL